MIEEFDDQQHHCRGDVDACHHNRTPSIQTAFAKDVCSRVSAFDDLGNPFEAESNDLFVLDTKEISDQSSVEVVRNVRKIGQ